MQIIILCRVARVQLKKTENDRNLKFSYAMKDDVHEGKLEVTRMVQKCPEDRGIAAIAAGCLICL